MDRPQTLFTRLAQDAENGHLYLEPHAAANCAQACEQFLDVLNTLLIEADRLQCKEAFGPLPSAQSLGQKFDDKAIGPGGFTEVLQQHIDTVTRMKYLFEAAGKAYVETEDENARAFATIPGGR
ncbi:hypothetical protein I0Q12_01975 [Rhodococcus sp. CX]|uniref:hypothetical protein n=1 Tax=Rhodococcus sp. CX TaxID=2789880 RepID=UPI0018CEC346|nr:hypothetical protein [Rhodococcus sp. CX]MBH0118367.1 hypothetical protein [Rhodococcus sp. CX]